MTPQTSYNHISQNNKCDNIARTLIIFCYLHRDKDYKLDYIKKLESSAHACFTEDDQHALWALLSCAGLAIAQYALYERYGRKANSFIKYLEVLLDLSLRESKLSKHNRKLVNTWIKKSFFVFKEEYAALDEYNLYDLMAKLCNIFKLNIEQKGSSQLVLGLFIYIKEIKSIADAILDDVKKDIDFATHCID